MKTMVRVQRRKSPYVQIDKGFLDEPRLGLEGMGLLTWLLAKPDDWSVNVRAIARMTGVSQYAARRALARLEACGHLRRSPVRDRRNGRIIRWEVLVYETPNLARPPEASDCTLFESVEPRKPCFSRITPDVEIPLAGEPAAGSPLAGEPAAGGLPVLRNEERRNEETEERRRNDAGRAIPGVADARGESRGGPASSSPPPGPTEHTPGVTGNPARTADEAPAGQSPGASATPPATPPAPPDPDDPPGDAVAELIDSAGFDRRDAARLVRRHGADAALRAVRCLRQASHRPGNPRGFVVRAIGERWTPAERAPPFDPVAEAMRAIEMARLEVSA